MDAENTLSLFDALAARDAADRAVERAAQGAGPAWMKRTLAAITAVARQHPTLTTDDVWRLVTEPPEPRAMGAAMREAAKAGLIEPTREYRPSERVACHGRPLRVWRSRLYRASVRPWG